MTLLFSTNIFKLIILFVNRGDMSQRTLQTNDYQKFLNDVTENIINTIPDSSNQKLWIQMGDALEMSNIPKDQISTIMRKDIEQILYDKVYHEFGPRENYKWHNNTYWLVTKAHGWTNPEMARNTNDNLDPIRIKEIVPCANPDMKAVCYDLINLCRILIDKSKDCESFEDIFGEKQMNEFYKQMHTAINNCKDATDSKTKVPRDTEVFLLGYLSTVIGNVSKCAELFMNNNLSLLKEQGKFLTTKQASKFQKGMKQSQQFILKPINRDTAIYEGYTGVQCTCGSFRVRPTQNLNGLECYDCGTITTGVYIAKCTSCYTPLYKKRLLHIVNTGKCKNCNEIVDLPPSLIEYAKS